MTNVKEENEKEIEEHWQSKAPAIIVQLSTPEFQALVLEKLGRLETKVDTLVGNGQPGRMKLAEDRIATLERSDIRRSVYDRVANATIAFLVSVTIAMHDHLGIR